MSALDVAESARAVAQIDRCIEAGSRAVERLCHRRFYPTYATRYLDWPSLQLGTTYRLYLDQDTELVELESVSSGGSTLTHYFLEPQTGPPYTRLEIDRTEGDAFGGDNDQRAITLVGAFGACGDVEAIGTTAELLNTTDTGLDASGMRVGVGDLLRVDDEWMQITDRAQLATGASLAADLAALPRAATLTLAGTFTFALGEVIAIDGERMLITDAYDSTVVVERQWSGSVLAAHTAGATVRAPRTLTVARAAIGSSAAAHANGATVYRLTPPPLVRNLAIAEALLQLAREQSGLARTVGSGDGERNATSSDIRDLREQCYAAHGRMMRLGVV